jgi:BirA family transcriptional regulator, biotin operon repressor / biotin---[acetyl-CoA-carboxylase] ligase
MTEIELVLHTEIIGREIKVFNNLDSTNIKAKELAKEGFPSGTVIIAEEQTAGKGRRGRNWFSPKGSGLWFSLLVRPDISPDRATFLTIIASLAVVEAFEEIAPELNPIIKWPNDIMIKGRKVCGILSELGTEDNNINYAVIGIGINVNQTSFPEELSTKATSLQLVLGRPVDRFGLLQEVLNSFEIYYIRLLEKRFDELLQEWKARLNLTGEKVLIENGSDIYHGRVVDLSSLGELIIEDEDGKIRSFWAGDVSLRKKR